MAVSVIWNETRMRLGKRKIVVSHRDSMSFEERHRFTALGLIVKGFFHKHCPDVSTRVRAR